MYYRAYERIRVVIHVHVYHTPSELFHNFYLEIEKKKKTKLVHEKILAFPLTIILSKVLVKT